MRFVADPALLSVGPRSWAVLVLIVFVLPAVALRQHRAMMAGDMPVPSRQRLYVSALATHAVLLTLVWLVSSETRAVFLTAYSPRWWHVLLGLIALAIGLTPVVARVELEGAVGRERVRLLAPRTRGEHALFYVVSVSAGFAEELAFRGALFTLLAALIGGWLAPALLTSATFGLVHVFQGWRGAALAGLIGLREQLVVGLTGTLFVAIVVHMLHNAIAGTLIARWAHGDPGAGR